MESRLSSGGLGAGSRIEGSVVAIVRREVEGRYVVTEAEREVADLLPIEVDPAVARATVKEVPFWFHTFALTALRASPRPAPRAITATASLLAEPFGSFDGGRMAVVADPAGAVFGSLTRCAPRWAPGVHTREPAVPGAQMSETGRSWERRNRSSKRNRNSVMGGRQG